MKPASTTVAPGLTASVSPTAPGWGPTRDVFTRWDSPVFTHSLTPEPYGTLMASSSGKAPDPEVGAEYVAGNSFFKNADVEFTVTGRQFTIRYLAAQATDAMAWVDDQPVAAQPFDTPDYTELGSFRWLTITLDRPRTVKVRFAGPAVFSGVEHDSQDPVRLSKAPRRYTLGVVGDSYYESTIGDGWRSSAAPVELSTLTGFRVRNLAQGGTGYLNDATGAALKGDFGVPGHYATPYGSEQRLAEIADAPVDALLVNGSINDGPPFTRLQHRKAVKDFLDDVHRVRPELPIVLVGVEPVVFWYAPDVSLKPFLDLEENLRCEMRTHPQVRGVVQPYRENWLTGTGYVDRPMHDGNQDEYIGKDWIHPTAAGVAFYQRKVVAALRTMTL
ncbi:MAG: SGNH/GDSL hydrolase family protein, partial [Actinomycetales bacterium]